MNFFGKTTARVIMALSAFVILSVSCNDEDKIGGNDGPSEEELQFTDSLDNAFARQVRAMKTLVMDSSAGISSCEVSEVGLAQVTLSDGSSFISYAGEDEYYGILSYVSEGDENFWALLDKGGNSSVLKSGENKMMSMSAELKLSLSGAAYKVTANGLDFETAFAKEDKVQAFRCVFHKDDESEVYAVTFDYGGQLQKTYLVTGYDGVGFRLPYGEDKAFISEYYVNNASTSSVVLEIPAGIEYTLEASEGWAAVARKVADVTYVDVTAPAKAEDVQTGVLKVIYGEDLELAQIALTDAPFRSIFTSSTGLVVNPSTGLRKYVYGLSLVEDYSDDDALAKAEALASGGTAASGYGISEASVNVSFTDLIGGGLDPEKRYVLWAVPAQYKEGQGYSIDPQTLYKNEFGAMSFGIELVEARLLDADLKVGVRGADAVFGGVIEKSDDAINDILFQLNNSILDSIPVTDQAFLYEGLMSDFPAADAEKHEVLPATTYLVWVSAAYTGEYEYKEDDVFYREVKTNDLTEGGSLTATFGEVAKTPSTLTVPVEAKGATMIYYALLNSSKGNIYSSADVPNAEKFKQLMANSPVAVRGESATASHIKLNPSTTYWVYAVAVDEDGKYGPVSCVSGKTEQLVYDTTISLTVERVNVTAKKAVLKVTSNGGDLSDYVYWTGRLTDPFWANSTHCGGSKAIAQKYIALNPDDENIVKAMGKYGPIASDGTITLDGLTMETDYVFVILEKGESHYSQAGYIKVTTLAADLGEIVREGTAAWEAGKASVQIEWFKNSFHQATSGNLMSNYSFNFKCADNLTAYILCGSEGYFEGAGITKMEHIMIEIENYSSRRYENGMTPMVNGELACEPDYYNKGELCGGQLMNVVEYYVHGVPNLGFVTYFAKGSHGDGNCIYWENNQCTIYESQKAKIARNLTMEPYLEKAKMFKLEGAEATAWAQALLEAYAPYYQNAEPIIFENDGNGVVVSNPYATGINEDGIVPDRVIVMLKDLQGNYYEPMYFEVPNYFED